MTASPADNVDHRDASDTIRENDKEDYTREVRKAADDYQGRAAGLDEDAQRELVDDLSDAALVGRDEVVAEIERREAR